MSTRSLNRIETSTNDSSFYYLNKVLQVAGLFFFINGIYVAFFSDNVFTTFGYYFVVIAAVCVTLAHAISPENPLISPELQATIRQLMSRTETKTSNNSRTPRRNTNSRNGFDVRLYFQALIEKIKVVRPSSNTSRRNGRDRL
ncbi:hypothetical protein [Haladaptatus caseinilyticus]|uniref:hypothetical protein n=1 Tax=Haladaptatus caseinilyticus TaxID=2993314 RepID=UPI00224A5035|nr:hypothetical protein [Haladaptatus caseinilyticus]